VFDFSFSGGLKLLGVRFRFLVGELKLLGVWFRFIGGDETSRCSIRFLGRT
jgi:hypothetical protein